MRMRVASGMRVVMSSPLHTPFSETVPRINPQAHIEKAEVARLQIRQLHTRSSVYHDHYGCAGGKPGRPAGCSAHPRSAVGQSRRIRTFATLLASPPMYMFWVSTRT